MPKTQGMSGRLALGVLSVLYLLLQLSFLAQSAQAPSEERLLTQANLAAKQRDYRKAAILYVAILKSHPDAAEIWSNLGMMHQFLGDQKSALREFEVAAHENPRLFVPNLFLGLDRLHHHDPKGALPYLKCAETIHPGDEHGALALGQAYEALRDFPNANRWFYRAATVRPKSPDAWYDLGSSYLDIQRQAVGQLQAIGSDSPYARLLGAEALIEQGKADRALQILRELTEGDHVIPDVHATLSLAYFTLHDLEAAEKESKLHAQDQSRQCRGILSSKMDGLKASDLLRITQCAYWLSDYRGALLASEHLSTVAPRYLPALYWQAKSAGTLATDSLMRAYRLAPDSVQSHMLMARIDLDKGRFNQAAAEYTKALQASGNSPKAELGLATAQYLDFHLDEAMTEAKKVLAAEPQSPQANLLMGEILLRLHQDAKAIPYLTTALTGPPPADPRVHALLAQCYAAEGRTDVAIREWRQALPGDIDGSFHYQLYRLYLKVGDRTDAAIVLQQSLKLWKKQAQPESR